MNYATKAQKEKSTFTTKGPITLISVNVPTLTLTMLTPEKKGLFYENISLVVSSTPTENSLFF